MQKNQNFSLIRSIMLIISEICLVDCTLEPQQENIMQRNKNHGLWRFQIYCEAAKKKLN